MSWAGLGRDPGDKSAKSHGFHWLEQAQEAEKLAKKTTLTGEVRTNAWRYAGHCHFQAAFQSSDPATFNTWMKKAEDCFRNSAVSIGENDAMTSDLHRKRFEGLALYCVAQQEPDMSKALNRLHEAHDLLTEAWAAGGKEPDRFLPVLGLELLHVTNDMMYYEPEVTRRLPRLQTGREVSKQVETLLPKLDKNLLALFIAELVELHVRLWMHLPTIQEREAEGKRGLDLFERLSREISHSDDPRCAVAALALQLQNEALLPTRRLIVEVDTVRPFVEETKDKLAIGSYLAAVLRSHLEPLREAEDPEVAKDLLAQSEKEAAEALLDLQAFGGIRRFRTSPGYVLWTRADILGMYGRYQAGSSRERLRLATEAVTISYRIGENGPPLSYAGQYSNLGYYLHQRAVLEEDPTQREKSLEEAWKAGLGYQETTHLFFPHWDLGDADHYRLYGHIRREQAKTRLKDDASTLSESVKMYQIAADCQKRAVNTVFSGEQDRERSVLGHYLYELGSTQVDLYTRTREPQLLEAALSNLQSSAEAASSQDAPTRAAETLGRIGEAYLLAGQYEQARNAFTEAASRCEAASTKYPGLSQAFQSRALLMKSRAATAMARRDYNTDRFDSSAHHYREASKFLKEAPAWQGLASLYDAWAMVADAEGQSRAEPDIAIRMLESAIGQFTEAEKALQVQSSTGSEGEEQTLDAQRRLLVQGRGYAQARLLLERARILGRQGEAVESIDHLTQAAHKFEAMADASDDLETQDLMRNNALVCKASMVMVQAEQQLNPDLYAQASGLFLKARQGSKTRHVATIAGGWAACCKALELGLRYRESSDRSLFEALKKQLASAMGYFVDAGASNIVSWLKGTGCMFDAMAYLAEGEASLSTGERESHYRRAEQELQRAAGFFERANYPARKEDAVRFLQSTVEQRKAIADRVIQDAPITLSVKGVAGQTSSEELLIGSGAVATPAIHAALRGPDDPLLAGREAKIHLTLLNPGQNILRLVSVENLESHGLQFRGTEQHPIRDNKVELGGKRLTPLTVFELPIHVRPQRPGEYKLHPRVRFLNIQGEMNSEPIPTLTLKVEKTGIRSWLRGPEN